MSETFEDEKQAGRAMWQRGEIIISVRAANADGDLVEASATVCAEVLDSVGAVAQHAAIDELLGLVRPAVEL